MFISVINYNSLNDVINFIEKNTENETLYIDIHGTKLPADQAQKTNPNEFITHALNRIIDVIHNKLTFSLTINLNLADIQNPNIDVFDKKLFSLVNELLDQGIEHFNLNNPKNHPNTYQLLQERKNKIIEKELAREKNRKLTSIKFLSQSFKHLFNHKSVVNEELNENLIKKTY